MNKLGNAFIAIATLFSVVLAFMMQYGSIDTGRAFGLIFLLISFMGVGFYFRELEADLRKNEQKQRERRKAALEAREKEIQRKRLGNAIYDNPGRKVS